MALFLRKDAIKCKPRGWAPGLGELPLEQGRGCGSKIAASLQRRSRRGDQNRQRASGSEGAVARAPRAEAELRPGPRRLRAQLPPQEQITARAGGGPGLGAPPGLAALAAHVARA